MHSRHFAVIVVILLMSLVLSTQVGLAQDGYEQLVARALSDLGTNCANVSANSLCVAFDSVEVSFISATPEGFSGLPGDRAELTDVSSVKTTPVNLADSTLGIALMYVKTTNVPGALTDQSALFMLIGDAEVTNAVAPTVAFVPIAPVIVTTVAQTEVRAAPGSDALLMGTVTADTQLQADAVSPGATWIRVMYENQVGWVSRQALDPNAGVGTLPVLTGASRTPMQAFTFRTGGTTPPSLAVPPDVLMVQSPKDIAIDIWANDIHIRVQGVIFLRTLADGRIQLITADGEAEAYPETPQHVKVVAGTSIILGGGTWTEWRIVTEEEWEGYTIFEEIPGNITIYVIILPEIIQPSSIIIPPPIIIIVPGGEIIPIPVDPPSFPPIPYTFGEPGEDLERVEWVPFEVGCAVCDPDLVLYHSDADGDWDIYRLVEDGLSEADNNISRGDTSHDLMPSYSPDAAWVAYTTNRYVLGGWEIQVSRIDGTADARVSFNTGNDVNPVWGPANLIVWETNRRGNWDLFMLDVAGEGEEVQLTDDPANDVNPFWFPDGGCDVAGTQRLVFQSDRDGDWEIYELNIETLEVTQLTDNDTEDEMPILSRDGTQLAWVQLDEYGVYNLWVMDLGTMEARQLTALGENVAGHMFAPDGSLIAFQSNLDEDYDVFAVYLSDDEIVAVTSNTAEDRAPTFRCTDPQLAIYHSDVAADDENPGQRELFESRVPVQGGTANPPVRLTQDVEADEIYAQSDAHEERESKEGRKPAHP